MIATNIILKLSIPHFHEKNRIAEQKSQTLIECVRYTIIWGEILDKLWLKILLAIIYISNLPTILSLQSLFYFTVSS